MENIPILKSSITSNKKKKTFYKYDIGGNKFEFSKTFDGLVSTVIVHLRYASVILTDKHNGREPVKFEIKTLYSQEIIPKLLGTCLYIYNYCLQIKSDIEEFFEIFQNK